MTQPIRVLYVAGLGRSGSTILGRILGEIPGVVSLGELQRVWLRGAVENQPCACRRPFSSCPLWSRVRAAGGATGGADAARKLIDWMDAYLRTRHFPALLSQSGTWLRKRPGFVEAAREVSDLYAAAGAATGANLIVDTSKNPVYARFLGHLPGIDLSIVHLLRDPRAAAHSWRRVRRHPLTGEVGMRFGLVKSAGLWSIWNLMVSWIGKGTPQPIPVLRLRYEDFISMPQSTIHQIKKFVGLAEMEGPFIDDRTVLLGENHMLSGSLERYEWGEIELRPREGWRDEMGSHEKMLVTLLCLPLIAANGYQLLA